MASIIKRKKSYSVVYNYIDENGETKQKWETWHTHKEALKRKAEVENQQNNGTFLPPNNQKVSDFLYDFVSTYGEKKWGVSMYEQSNSLDCQLYQSDYRRYGGSGNYSPCGRQIHSDSSKDPSCL